MKKGLTEIVFILDRSGSMSGLEADTIGGYNSMLERQKKEEGDAVLSTVLFDDRCEILHDRISVKKVEKITDDEYYVRGCTALLDAVGGAIEHIGKIHKELPDDEKPEKTLFIITTDGMEKCQPTLRLRYRKETRGEEKEKTSLGVHLLGCQHRCGFRCRKVRCRQVPRRSLSVRQHRYKDQLRRDVQNGQLRKSLRIRCPDERSFQR